MPAYRTFILCADGEEGLELIESAQLLDEGEEVEQLALQTAWDPHEDGSIGKWTIAVGVWVNESWCIVTRDGSPSVDMVVDRTPTK